MSTRTFLFLLTLPLLPSACGSDDQATPDTDDSESSGSADATATMTTSDTSGDATLTTTPDDGSSDDDSTTPSTSADDTTSAMTDGTDSTDTSDSTDTTDSTDTSGSTDGEGSSESGSTGDAVGYELIDPASEVFGNSYAEWAAIWWQWLYELPTTGHPVLDTTGVDCEGGQQYAVFILAGTFGGDPVVRDCTISGDRPVLLPIVNSSWDNAGLLEEDYYSDQGLQDGAVAFIDGIDDFGLEIDGDVYDMDALAAYRVGLYESSYVVIEDDSLYDVLFGYPVPVDGLVEPTYGDGIYVMMNLTAGSHELHFFSTELNDPDVAEDDWTIDVTYNLEVE